MGYFSTSTNMTSEGRSTTKVNIFNDSKETIYNIRLVGENTNLVATLKRLKPNHEKLLIPITKLLDIKTNIYLVFDDEEGKEHTLLLCESATKDSCFKINLKVLKEEDIFSYLISEIKE